MISARGILLRAGLAHAAVRRARVCSMKPPVDGAAGARRSMSRRLQHFLSHRLEGTVELDVDQHGSRVLERGCEKIGRLMHGPRAVGLYPERASKPHEIDLRVGELHS